jgi:tRNA 5-methylaminomethyl-2-thiouridine biosynthesis bifunctional protein
MQFANLKWNQQQPYSLDFDDVYYSSDDGLAETEYVFIQHNQLVDRFSNLKTKAFTIIETGFGTGLNCFCAIQCFMAHAPADATLRFISIERYPLQPADFIKANQNWPIFDGLVKQLQQTYAQIKEGCNVFNMYQNRIQIHLWIGDINVCLPLLNSPADALFLDGFAPSKNSDMWSALLFNELARLSKPNTTFATFTSASLIRRQLQAAGFNVYKAAGFGKKREMLYGVYA